MKKFIIFKTVSGQQVFVNRELVTHVEPSTGWQNDFIGLNMPQSFWKISGHPVGAQQSIDCVDVNIEMKKNKTVIYLSGNNMPVIVDTPIIHVLKLLDLEHNYDLEESIYG